MNIYESRLWRNDLDRVLDSLPELSLLNGKRILVTGATGLICSAIIDIMVRYSERQGGNICIYAAGRNQGRIENRFPLGVSKRFVHFVPYDATKAAPETEETMDYILHGASNTMPSQYVQEPVETMISNFNGVKDLLDILKKQGTGKLLYVSSSEVYGKKENIEPYTEDEYGFVDILNPRNSYPMGKRAAEALCAAYSREYGIQTVMVRPGHIYGPTASSKDGRVSSAWAYDVAQGKDIVMKSDGRQIRSYCYCLDCAAAILKVILRGKNSEAYNISNPDSIISIRDMAQILCQYAGVKLVYDNADAGDKKTFNPMSNSSLNSEKLQKLGWRGLFNAQEGFQHTYLILREVLG